MNTEDLKGRESKFKVGDSNEERGESLEGCLLGEVNFHQNRFQVGVGNLPGVGSLGDQRQCLEGEFQNTSEGKREEFLLWVLMDPST